MTTSPPVISPSHSHYSSFNFEGELDKDISSAYSNMSLDTPLQGEYIDEPVQMSPETERKLLLAHSAPLVPDIIKKSVDYLQSKGMMMEGIFRVSGAKSRINKIRERFDRGGAPVRLTDDLNPHDVACLLKEYLRCLPEPLICKELYSLFLQTRRVETRSKRRDTLRLLCLLLPKPNRDTLQCLLHFLNQVALHSNDIIMIDGTEEQGNKMSEENLGMIMGPNILHKRKIAGQSDYGGYQKGEKDDIMAVSQVVEDLITMESSIFMVPAELLDEAIDKLILVDPILADRLLRSKCRGLEDEDDQSTLDVRYTGYSKESSSSRLPIHRSKSSDTLRYRTTDVGGNMKKKASGEQAVYIAPPPEEILAVSRVISTPVGAFGESKPVALSTVTTDTRQSQESLCDEIEEKSPLEEEEEEVSEERSEDKKGKNSDDEGVHLTAEDKPSNGGQDPSKRTVSADASVYLKNTSDVGGESPLSAIHKRMNSESSSGSTPVTAFPGDCKRQGSDSAFSFTNSSLNTGSRSSSEGISPVCDVPDGRVSATGVTPHPRKGPPYDSPKYPHISKDDTQSGKKPPAQRNTSKENVDMDSLQLKFKELESKVAELDSQVSGLRQTPPFTHTGSQQTPSHSKFTDLDFQFEKLTSELSILDSLSQQPSSSESVALRNTAGFYSSGSSKHGLHQPFLSSNQRKETTSQHPTKGRKISAPPPRQNVQSQSPVVAAKSHSQSPRHTRSRSRSNSASRSPGPPSQNSLKAKSPRNYPRRGSAGSEPEESPLHDNPLAAKGIMQHGPERMV
jgi:hypothetical protein